MAFIVGRFTFSKDERQSGSENQDCLLSAWFAALETML
jgi:hypothetical protein